MTASSMEYVRTDSHRVLQPVFLATTMILAAEVVYLIVWGLMLFPGGSLVGKLAWALTCSVGMGAIVGVATIVLTGENMGRWARMSVAAAVMAAIGSFCTLICSAIDMKFSYFGGPENTGLFIASGLIPSVLGGLLYGWLVSRPQPGAKQ